MKRIMIFCGVLIIAAAVPLVAQTQYYFDDFSSFDTSRYNLYHEAAFDAANGNIRLTPNSRYQAGRCYMESLLPMNDFLVEFDFYQGDGNISDGIVFAFTENQNYSRTAGEYHDFAGAIGYGIVANDYRNPGDPVTFYIGLLHNSWRDPLAYWPTTDQYLRNRWHNMKVRNLMGHIQVWVDDSLRIDYQVSNYVPFQGYFGFTAATGLLYDVHRIDNFTIHYVKGIIDVSLLPRLDSTSVAGSLNYTLSLTNHDSLAFPITISCEGLDSSWYSLSKQSFLILSGQKAYDTLNISLPSQSGIIGNYNFIINCHIGLLDSIIPSTATLKIINGPIIEYLAPPSGWKASAGDICFAWYTSAICSTEVYLKPSDSTAYRCYLGEPTRNHSVMVSGFERNRSYDWYARSSGDWGGVSTSDVRQFYVDNGIVFSQDAYAQTIERDYDQRLVVEVENTDSVYHTVMLEADSLYPDLPINFIGDGSLDNLLLLNPGQAAVCTLAVHGQDATQTDYTIPLRLTSIGGADSISDYALAQLHVETPIVSASLIETGTEVGSLAKSYLFVNHGDPITDLTISASDSLNAHIYFEPQVEHAYLQTGDSLLFKAIPILMPEDTLIILGMRQRGEEISFPSERLMSFSGMVKASYLDTTLSLFSDFTPPQGETVFLAHLDNITQCFNKVGWYCTNRPNIYVNFRFPPMAPPQNAFFQMDFAPRRPNQRNHDIHVHMNGQEIGNILNTVPQGTYNFAAPPEIMNFSPAEVSINQIYINTVHMNGGHYIVSNNMKICLCIGTLERYISAQSQEEANVRLLTLIGVPPENIAVNIINPMEGESFDQGSFVLVKAAVLADSAAGVNLPVQTTIGGGCQPLVLFDDGDHGDDAASDGIYAGTWVPRDSGLVALAARAGGCSAAGSDTVGVHIQGPTSIAVAVHTPESSSYLVSGQATYITASIEDNFGNRIPGPQMNFVIASIGCDANRSISLLDDGQCGDQQAHDGLFGAQWQPNPTDTGFCQLIFEASHATLGVSVDTIVVSIVEPSLILLDQDDPPRPITQKSFSFFKIKSDGSDSLLGNRSSDDQGKVLLPIWWLQAGNPFKVLLPVDTIFAQKPDHQSVDSIMYCIYLDNALLDSTGHTAYSQYLRTPPQDTVILGHASIGFNLICTLEWDAGRDFIDSVIAGLRLASNYLYDATDGQAYIAKVCVNDNKKLWQNCDLKIYGSNFYLPVTAMHGDTQCVSTPISGIEGRAHISRSYTAGNQYSLDCLRNTTYNYHPGWTEHETLFNNKSFYWPTTRALAHELGHYLFGFADESDGSRVDGFNDQVRNFDFGLMDFPIDADIPINSEMSSWYHYENGNNRSTNQWVYRGGHSCWDYFECVYEGTYNSIYVPIHKPDELPSVCMNIGPNNDLGNPEPWADKGKTMEVVISDTNTSAFTYDLYVQFHGQAVDGASVSVIDALGRMKFEHGEGQTTDNGHILCLGINCGDTIKVTKNDWLWGPLWSKITVCSRAITEIDSGEIDLRQIEGRYPLLMDAEFVNEQTIDIRLVAENLFFAYPTFRDYRYGEEPIDYSFELAGHVYECAITPYEEGVFTIGALDDSLVGFDLDYMYRVYPIGNESGLEILRAPDGYSEIHLWTGNELLDQLMLICADYPPPTAAPDSLIHLLGSIITISDWPAGSLAGSNELVVPYPEPIGNEITDASAKLFRWSTTAARWEDTPGHVDTTDNIAHFELSQAGTYAVFAGPHICSYVPGDANGNKTANGIDVTYMVSYLKGIGYAPPDACDCPPTPFPLYAAADANGNCQFNGIDVTYMVSYLKGLGSAPRPCAHCAPLIFTKPELPVTSILKPVLKAGPKKEDNSK